MISRRGLFGLIPALGALVVPASAKAVEDNEVKPIIYEHTCDGGRCHLTSPEVRRLLDTGYLFRGCGTTFQWHFGVPPYCPKCGYAYEMTLEKLKNYSRVQ